MSSDYPEKPILLIDDEPDFLQSLSLLLRLQNGLSNLVECCDSRQVETLLAERSYSLVITDLTMPYVSGEAVLEHIAKKYPDLPVIILTGMNQIEQAVKCIQAGAFDYFVKTSEAERLVAGVVRALKTAELQQECFRLKQTVLSIDLLNPTVFSEIATADAKMHALFRYLEAIAISPEPVLITGESGVGKELVAKALQRLVKPEKPWVAINVAGVDDTVFSDTLFGHLRGAFTGAEKSRAGMIEQARGGVLFLDEIGDLSPDSQVKLLRLLQEGEYFPLGSDKPKYSNARIVVATNHDLKQRQDEGLFRKDLYYRLLAHHVHVPPLRERKSDIPLLLDQFLTEAAEKLQKKKPTPPDELNTLLSLYSFPGNVRELRAMVFNAVSLHKSKMLSMDSFRQAIDIDSTPTGSDGTVDSVEPLLTFHTNLPNLKLASGLLVEEAMRRTKGNQALAAKLLGISPPSLSARLKKLRS